MNAPKFNSFEEANLWLKERFKKLVADFEKSTNLEEKKKILREFDFEEINAEEQPSPIWFSLVKIKDTPEYQKIKSLLKDFFDWVERNNKINAPLEVYLNSFFAENQSSKMVLIAEQLKRYSQLTQLEQVNAMLSILRLLYELNLRMLIIILEASLKKQNKPTNKHFELKNFIEEFKDYPKKNELEKCFKNFMRNPIAHESWVFRGEEKIVFMNKGVETEFSIFQIGEEIGNLILFKVAFQSCALEKYKEILTTSQIAEDQVNKIYQNFKRGLDNLEREKSPSKPASL